MARIWGGIFDDCSVSFTAARTMDARAQHAVVTNVLTAGLVFAIAVIGGMFSLAGRASRHLKRRRIRQRTHMATRCRWCNYADNRAKVALHEAQDHAERSG